jgi:hypothetical protein
MPEIESKWRFPGKARLTEGACRDDQFGSWLVQITAQGHTQAGPALSKTRGIAIKSKMRRPASFVNRKHTIQFQ